MALVSPSFSSPKIRKHPTGYVTITHFSCSGATRAKRKDIGDRFSDDLAQLALKQNPLGRASSFNVPINPDDPRRHPKGRPRMFAGNKESVFVFRAV